MATPNFPLQDVQKVPYAYYVEDADGNPESPQTGDAVSIVSSDVASASVAPDATVDPAKGTPGVTATPLQTGFIVGGSKLQTGVQVTATLTLAIPPASGQPAPKITLIDVTVGPEATGGLALGTAVSQ